MKIRLAQTKPALGNIEKNAEAHFAAIEAAIADGANIIVFPELSLSGYYLRDLVPDVSMTPDHPVIKRIAEYAAKIDIVCGFVEESPEHLFFNAGAYFADGGIRHLHRKVYLPDYTMFEEGRYFAAGERFTAFDTKYGKAGLLVCEDAMHLSSLHIIASQGIRTLYVIANSPARGITGETLAAADTWRALTHFAARLLTINVVFVNRAGVEDGVSFWGGSQVIEAGGRVLADLPLLEESFADASVSVDAVRRARLANPFLRDEKQWMLKRFLDGMEDQR